MTESSGVLTWAYGLLTAATPVTALVALRVYDSLAPQDASEPFVILQQQAYSEDGTSVTGSIGAGRMMLTVKAVTKASGFGTAEAIYAASHAAMQGQTGTATGVSIRACIRDSIIRYVEVKDGVRYNHLGGVYRIWALPA